MLEKVNVCTGIKFYMSILHLTILIEATVCKGSEIDQVSSIVFSELIWAIRSCQLSVN